ncbi:MAG: isoleucine--tRNA ligase, partial [Candidatus Uhrbacteria bacterium]
MANGRANFPQIEQEILEFWEKEKIFEKSLKKKSPQGDYVFYDGPPFATGLPHYGHIVASLLKDVVPRFWTMKGYHVDRVWGWDCHGLPIENIVEKESKIKSKADIERTGVGEFNESCRARVLDFVEDWKVVVRRLGRWVDMDNAYKTMDLDYMESVWWVFKQLYDRGLIYEGHRSMHICPRCETTLSQSEVAEGYRDVKDLSVIVELELVDEPGTYVLAWTTTPWTLIGNVALAVGADIEYVKLEKPDQGDGKLVRFIVAKDRLEEVFGEDEYSVVETFKGKDLVGKAYQPLFGYYAGDENLEHRANGWKIYAADFVLTEEGTGVVHIAPAFGEDDMLLGQQNDLPFVQHVKMNGDFKDEVTDFAGANVKPADDRMATDVEIMKFLHEAGTLFSKGKYEHSYPHCWRCDTPLLNYSTSSMFVAVTKMKEQLEKNAEAINWSPAHIKEGRFGKWLEGARDWSISRQRYWASVIPIWRCECGEEVVVGSVAELEKLSGQKVEDLHKHVVDEITWNCTCGQRMQRVPDVLDCWFESGSMPYAQMHYPFENKKKFEANFPAEYIAEGADQTRCWFYYLHVLATGVMESHAYKNVIVNGIVLAEDGKKMSKKLKNYPDPMKIVDTYGADALRYYLCTSSVMQADNLLFAEREVDEVVKKVLNLLSNVNSFYQQYEGKVEVADKPNTKHVLDAWILARLNELINEVSAGMENYNLVTASRPIRDFINDLSTWYLRRSRGRFKVEGPDQVAAMSTLHYVLLELSKVMAPFTPFIAERIYQDLNGHEESVHLAEWPIANKKLVNQELLENMKTAREIVSMALQAREENKMPVKQVLSKMQVMGLRELDLGLVDIIKDEINIKEISFEAGGDLATVLSWELTPELIREGMARETIRKVNGLRKDAGLTIEDSIELYIVGDDEVKTMITEHGEAIKQGTLASNL